MLGWPRSGWPWGQTARDSGPAALSAHSPLLPSRVLGSRPRSHPAGGDSGHSGGERLGKLRQGRNLSSPSPAAAPALPAARGGRTVSRELLHQYQGAGWGRGGQGWRDSGHGEDATVPTTAARSLSGLSGPSTVPSPIRSTALVSPDEGPKRLPGKERFYSYLPRDCLSPSVGAGTPSGALAECGDEGGCSSSC